MAQVQVPTYYSNVAAVIVKLFIKVSTSLGVV